MYVEIRTDDPSIIVAAVEKQITDGRTAQITIGKEGWLFTFSLLMGVTESDAANSANQTQDLRAA